MKIAIISPLILGINKTPDNYSSQQINLARSWAEAGHSVDIITGRQKGIEAELTLPGIRLFQRPLLWLGGKRGLPILLGGAFLLFRNRYDLVLSSEHYQPTTFMACMLSGNVVVYQGQNTPGSTAARRWAIRFIEILSFPLTRRRYRKVIAKTNNAEEFLRAKNFNRCATVPCGYDSDRFRMPSTEEKQMSRQTLGIPENARVLVYAGNLIPRRDVGTVIQSLAKLRKKHSSAILLIAGQGPDLERLKQLANETGVEPAVYFLGSLNWRDLRTAYWASDIFVFPTHYEIFGMVLLEALACGLKIVSTPCPAAKDILAECPGAGRITPIEDPDGFAECCEKIFTNRDTAEFFDRAAINYLKKHNWKSFY